MSLQAIDGGVGYYGRFSNPLPTAADYFPVAVWGSYNHTQANRDLDAAANINTYVWVGDDGARLPEIRADGRFHVVQASWVGGPTGAETAGWLLDDELDMTGGSCPDSLNQINAQLPADGRFRYANFGKGVVLPAPNPWVSSDQQAACWVNSTTHVVSGDLYWFTDTWEKAPYGYKYGDSVRRLRTLDATDGQRKPIWMFVEVGYCCDLPIKPEEIRSAAWHSIIAGARGLIWFQHSFHGPCAGDHHVTRTNCEGTRTTVTSVGAQIKSLAPVLNAPFVTSGWTADPAIKAMVKWHNGHFYLFTGATTTGAGASFSMPCIGNATATRLGEPGTTTITNGRLTDTYANKNAIHIYRIDGGSTCGL